MRRTRGSLRIAVAGTLVSVLLFPTIALAAPWQPVLVPVAGPVGAAISITGVTALPASVSRLVAPKAVTIRFRLSRSGKVTVKVYKSSTFVKTICSNKSFTSGAKSATWNLKDHHAAWVGDGTYTIKIWVVDSLHHAGKPNPATKTVYVDNTKPVATVSAVAPPTFSPSIGESTTVTFSLTDAHRNLPLGATVEVRSPANVLVHSATVPSVAQGGGRTMTWDGLTGLVAAPPGAYTVRIVARDAAGNLGYSPSKPLYVNGYGVPRPLDATPIISGTGVVRSDTGPDGLTHVVWIQDMGLGKRKIVWYRRLDAFGNTVVGPVIVDEDIDLANSVPDVSADTDGGAVVVWRGEGPTINEHSIQAARIAPDGTVAWQRGIAEDTYPYAMKDPRVDVGPDGMAHIVWACTGPRSTIYYTAIRRSGNPVLSTPALSQRNGTNIMKVPNVEVDDAGRVHVLWFESTPVGTTGKSQLFYTRLVPRVASALGSYSVDIDRRQLTNTTLAPSGWAYDWAPEMAANDAGTKVYAVWADQAPSYSSKGIRLMRLPGTAAEALTTPRRIVDCSTANTTNNLPGTAIMPAIVCNGSTQTVVFRATVMISGRPNRLWQMEVSDTTVGKPFVVTAGSWLDEMPSLTRGSDGHARLVYYGDTGVRWPGSANNYSHRVFYKDLAAEPKANDRMRHDLEIDAAHTSFASDRAIPRQNSPITVTAEIRNAGWAVSGGGVATLEYEGAVVDTSAFGSLSVEGTTSVQLHWTVPDDATRTPAPLAVRVTPAGETTQTSDGNDSTALSVYFLLPPETANLHLTVSDETWADDPWQLEPVNGATVTLTGTTVGGEARTWVRSTQGGMVRFDDVPLGRYVIGATKSHFVPSDPVTRAVTLLRDPADRYTVIATPGFWMTLLLNRWGGIDGSVHVADGTTPVAGATVVLSGPMSITTTSTPSGSVDMTRVPEGTYTVKTTKPWFVRSEKTVTITPGVSSPLDISLEPTTTGYLVGTITDEGGYPAINDPVATNDDPRMIVRTTTGTVVADISPHDGAFNISLPGGSYKLEFRCLGFRTQTDVSATVVGGLETDASTWLDYSVEDMKHAGSGEHWCVSWTAHANWFGDQIPGSPFESEDVKSWWGLYRFKFDGQYQKIGLNTSLKAIDFWARGEYWNACDDNVPDPPPSPHTFHSGKNPSLNPLAGGTTWYDIPPVADRTSRDLAAVRVDMIEVIDGRDWTVVSSVKQTWNSVSQPDGHRYGLLGDFADALALPAYAHSVPWNDQIVRVWLTAGHERSGAFVNAAWHDFGIGDMGSLFEASGYDQQVLCWDVSSGEVWVDPALVGYPTP